MKVFIIAALTVDGFIGRNAEHLADWTSPEDKKLFVQLTKEAGTMIMGSRTFATIGRALPGRRTIVYTSKPDDFSVEGVEATNQDPETLLEELEADGVTAVAICGGASVYGQFMRAGLVNELYLTIEPVLFGTGVPLFDASMEATLQLLESRQLNDNTVLLHYAIVTA